jgi:hypothetical protein
MSFSDEATFHVCEAVNRHNCRLWGSENPLDATEHGQCVERCDENKVIGPFFLEEPTVTDDTFLVMMENIALRHVPVGTVKVKLSLCFN